MTIDEARKLLGNDAINLSDIEIKENIETAELLKNMFFYLSKNEMLNKQSLSIQDCV